jgi:hypothetical protein
MNYFLIWYSQGGLGDSLYIYLYNNTRSNAIINAASDITYRPVIQAAVLNFNLLLFYA